MNFFKLYIGDYQRDTAHLSVTEHGAYMLMLQHYYATEKPLPTGKALHRMLRAHEKAERDAIDAVAAQFWTQTQQGLVNDRALEEIAKSERQRSVNREIGKRGGRPKRIKTESVSESVSESEPNDNPNQTPDTIQTPLPPASGGGRSFARFWAAYPSGSRKVAKAKCEERWRRLGLDAHADAIVAHVAAMANTQQWRDGYEPAPLTYLNQRRWQDGVPEDRKLNGSSDKPWFMAAVAQ